MEKTWVWGRGGVRIALLAMAAGLPSLAVAGSDYSDEDLSVRFPSAFIRFRDVSTSGGESVANRWSSALNPASADWGEVPCKLGLIAAPYYSHVQFQSGVGLHVIGESLTWQTGKWGTVQPTLSQIRSNSAMDRLGLDFDYAVDIAQVQWAKRCGDWGFGANFNFAEVELSRQMGPVKVADSHAESYRFRFGALYEPAEKWLTGLTFEYGFAPSRTTALAVTPFGPMSVRMEDTQHQFVVRPGVSFEYAEGSTVFADYQYGAFFNEDFTLHSHRFNGGVDHRLLPWLCLRLGGSLDTRGNPGWTAGVGVYPTPWCSVDIGYQYDTLPELRPEFGRSQTLQITVSVRV